MVIDKERGKDENAVFAKYSSAFEEELMLWILNVQKFKMAHHKLLSKIKLNLYLQEAA